MDCKTIEGTGFGRFGRAGWYCYKELEKFTSVFPPQSKYVKIYFLFSSNDIFKDSNNPEGGSNHKALESTPIKQTCVCSKLQGDEPNRIIDNNKLINGFWCKQKIVNWNQHQSFSFTTD